MLLSSESRCLAQLELRDGKVQIWKIDLDQMVGCITEEISVAQRSLALKQSDS